MSGGYINRPGLGPGEHVQITFAIKGTDDGPDAATCAAWDDAIQGLKRLFGNNMIGISVIGENTPNSRKKPKAGKKKATRK